MSSEKYTKIGPIIEINADGSEFDLYKINEKYELVDESFHPVETSESTICLLENKPREGNVPDELDMDEEFYSMEINAEIIHKNMAWFEKYFADDILAFKKEFGEDNVRVYFGVCSFYL